MLPAPRAPGAATTLTRAQLRAGLTLVTLVTIMLHMRQKKDPSAWLLLVTTQPTGNAALRMRVWREVRRLGAAILRDGVYLLPARAQLGAAFGELAREVGQGEGSAHVMRIDASGEQQEQWRALFDRGADYGELLKRCQKLRGRLRGDRVDALRKEVRALDAELAALAAIDYFPGAAAEQLQGALADLRGAVERLAAPDEPSSVAGRIARRERSRYAKRIWATRRGLWVDRVASAWLIRRFIDPDARFHWFAQPADMPKRAVGFDFDGAEFTHVVGRVTFEVLVASFGLDGDATLAAMGAIVHALDAGGAPVEAAAGVELVLKGLRQTHRDDDHFLAAAATVLDALYAAHAADRDESANP